MLPLNPEQAARVKADTPNSGIISLGDCPNSRKKPQHLNLNKVSGTANRAGDIRCQIEVIKNQPTCFELNNTQGGDKDA